MGGRSTLRTRKPRKATYAGLKRKADAVFSEYIRRSHAASDGGVYCYTCTRRDHWTRMQCGHFVSRVHLATRWDETNCKVQDYACNVLRRGNPSEFAIGLVREYGPTILEELVDKKRKQVKYTRSDLENLIAHYKQKLTELE